LYLFFVVISIQDNLTILFAASKQHFCVMYTTQYYLLKRFVGLDQVVSRWCCGLFRLSLLLIPCLWVCSSKYCTVLIFSSGFVMLCYPLFRYSCWSSDLFGFLVK
jgi:hypothetical protein